MYYICNAYILHIKRCDIYALTNDLKRECVWGRTEIDFRTLIMSIVKNEMRERITNDFNKFLQNARCKVKSLTMPKQIGNLLDDLRIPQGSVVDIKMSQTNYNFLFKELDKKMVVYDNFMTTILCKDTRNIVGSYLDLEFKYCIEVPLGVAMSYVVLKYMVVRLDREWMMPVVDWNHPDINQFLNVLNKYINVKNYTGNPNNDLTNEGKLMKLLNMYIPYKQNIYRDDIWLGGYRCNNITLSTKVILGHIVKFVESLKCCLDLWESILETNNLNLM